MCGVRLISSDWQGSSSDLTRVRWKVINILLILQQKESRYTVIGQTADRQQQKLRQQEIFRAWSWCYKRLYYIGKLLYSIIYKQTKETQCPPS